MSKSNLVVVSILILLTIALVVVATAYLPEGIDWRDTYRPAALALLSGKSPFSVEIYFAAPWGLVPLLPLAVLPERLGRAILLLASLAAFAFTARRLGAKPWALIAFLVSPPVLHCLLNANIEWMPLLGCVLPPQWGLLLIALKPQIGIAVAIFWLVESWRKGSWREVMHVFAPLAIITLMSFGLFGLWPLRWQATMTLTRDYNASLWPSTIPVGLALLVASLRLRQIKPAMAASPCLSPYVLLHAWVGALAALVSSTAETLAAVIGLWILVVLRGLSGGL